MLLMIPDSGLRSDRAGGLHIIRASFSQERMTYMASFSQERMTYIRDEAKIIYQSKDGREEKMFDALEWPALLNRVPFREI